MKDLIDGTKASRFLATESRVRRAGTEGAARRPKIDFDVIELVAIAKSKAVKSALKLNIFRLIHVKVILKPRWDKNI